MAKNIYGPGPHYPFEGTAGDAIAAGDLLTRSSTKWIPATDGQQAEGIALTEASGDGVTFKLSTEEGLLAVFTGTLAANATAYVADHDAVDAGSQNNKNCGISIGLCPWDSTKCVVKLHFKDAETISHA